MGVFFCIMDCYIKLFCNFIKKAPPIEKSNFMPAPANIPSSSKMPAFDPVTLKPLFHKEKECIGIYFEKNATINQAIKQTGAKWTQTHRCWYLPFDRIHYQKIISVLKEKATINADALKAGSPRKLTNAQNPGFIVANNQVNGHVLPAMQQQLVLKGYSPSTIKTYLGEMVQLLQTLKTVSADSLTPERLKRYLAYCAESLKLSENTLHSRINALKFYYEQVLGRTKFFWEIPRPKKPNKLPRLLNEDELARLFNAINNKKHKAMLFTAYSAGLRVSEIVNLKLVDIDSRRMQIFIERAKGKKDRYVNLSPLLLDILRSYIKEYKPHPRRYLFESAQTGTAYPTRTVQQIFNTARQKAGIRKEVGIHSLRHSFATHLLDKGTDIRYIKDLLGHFNIKTTERYLHVSKKQLVNVISPLDDLLRKESIEW